MYKKPLYLLLGALLISIGQACVASENKKKTSQVPQSQATDIQSSKRHTPRTRDAVYASSRYKPTGLILNLDFEDEEVRSVKGSQGKYDMLVLQMPTGQPTAAGIYYEDGKVSDRRARIVADPENRQNQVLHYWLKNARALGQRKGMSKGRIQLDFVDVNKTSLFQRYRLYLHPDVAFYRQFPKRYSWFNLSTMWMGLAWKGHKHPFKISLNLYKPKGVGKPMYFSVGGGIFLGGTRGRGDWGDLWNEVGTKFEVPVGEWIDIEVGYKAGNKRTGRYYMGVKREKDKNFTTIFDITNWTYHPKSPKPVPVINVNPLKLYSSSQVIDFIRNKGGVAQVYWDDLEAYEYW